VGPRGSHQDSRGASRDAREARDKIATWKRGEPSRVMTFDELFAWLDALDAADEDR
jgi:hypothetical protein